MRVALGLACALALVASHAARAQMLEPDAPWAAEDPSAEEAAAAAPAVPPTPAVAPGDELERAWLDPAPSLEARVSRTRRTSLELGVWSLDGAARAVLSGGFPGDALTRASAAVRLAPDLPAGRIELARALWLEEDEPLSALRAAFGALAVIPRHVEASLWFGGWALCILAAALVGGGLICIAVAAAAAALHAAHDLGDRVSRHTPSWARAALFASALLLPLALGEGAMGVALTALLLGLLYGGARQRVVLWLAAAAVIAGAYPVARLAGSTLLLFADDPVAEAALSVSQGVGLAADLRRLEAAADDPLAQRALALHARRQGNLAMADAHYQALLASHPGDVMIANNAANVRLRLGHMETALALYQRAIDRGAPAVALYNLSQAHGRAFQVDELASTLADAQQRNGKLVAELTGLQGADPQGFVVDLPLPRRLIWERVLHSDAGDRFAAHARAALAPGALGRDPRAAALAFACVALLGTLAGPRLERSRTCPRCGARLCPRCDPGAAHRELCAGCTQLFLQPETTDRALRLARVSALRRRERRIGRAVWATSLLIPGAAGAIADRPLRSWLGASLFAVALAAGRWREGVVPDPLVAGGAATFAFVGVVVIAAVAYAGVVALSLGTRRSS